MEKREKKNPNLFLQGSAEVTFKKKSSSTCENLKEIISSFSLKNTSKIKIEGV